MDRIAAFIAGIAMISAGAFCLILAWHIHQLNRKRNSQQSAISTQEE